MKETLSAVWQECKSFLYRNFISGTNELSPNLEHKEAANPIERWIVNSVTGSLRQSLDDPPINILVEIVSNIVYPADNDSKNLILALHGENFNQFWNTDKRRGKVKLKHGCISNKNNLKQWKTAKVSIVQMDLSKPNLDDMGEKNDYL